MNMPFQVVLGQLPLLKSYTDISLLFSLDDSQRDPVVWSLRSETKRLLEAFLFLAGGVIHKGIEPGHPWTFTVQDYDFENGIPEEKVDQILHGNEFSPRLTTHAAVEAAHAIPSMLPRSLVARPRPAFPRV